ncbi:hypothetical protein HCN44_000247 [Aphidius gifuensis]|uniref:Orcokinin n=1 Tax=Aphidius gifuensis TaxID=684658 RepID=A0A834XRP2_APHGI|nr:uncharacterized protein LOC122855180 [Aphidius gifuensis]KAF7990442.1 hypothetical protein HCN44_000247 [Aphidius gifuensis]
MSIARVICLTALFVLLITVYVNAVPVQIRGENDVVYADPAVVEALARSYAALAEARDINFQDGPFARQSRRGLDSLSGATFGQNKRFDSRNSKWLGNVNHVELLDGTAKRNMDEIDRSGFDNYMKRNFDEIDRAGWDSFVKRSMGNSYPQTRQH